MLHDFKSAFQSHLTYIAQLYPSALIVATMFELFILIISSFYSHVFWFLLGPKSCNTFLSNFAKLCLSVFVAHVLREYSAISM